jgi:hypothetical protein
LTLVSIRESLAFSLRKTSQKPSRRADFLTIEKLKSPRIVRLSKLVRKRGKNLTKKRGNWHNRSKMTSLSWKRRRTVTAPGYSL